MYFWKCWRDNRVRFIGSLIVLPALCALFTFVVARHGDPDAMRRGIHPSPMGAWSTTTEFVLGGWTAFFILIWGLLLGATSVGEEFQQGTAAFLLSRPRPRRYWVWVGWSAGVCELAAMLILTIAATLGTLTYLTGRIYSWWPLATLLPLLLGGVVVYGLTCLMALVARSGRQGMSYGIGILFIDTLLPPAARYYWDVHIPSLLGFMIDACKWFARTSSTFPIGELFLWIALALAFPAAIQLVLQRAEV